MKGIAIMIFSLLVLLLAISRPTEGTLLPLLDHPGSLFSELYQQRLADPFRVLEQIPLGFDKGDILVPPARVDWKETPESHIIMLDVPGLSKEELKIEVEESRLLRISGERRKEDEKKGDRWHRIERAYGKFWRQFRLPENVDLDSIHAKMENGVLTVTLAKLSPDQLKGPRVVSIAAREGEGMITGDAGEKEIKAEL